MSVSRDTFDSQKRYLKVIKMQGTPGVDSEFNEAQDILREELRGTILLIQSGKTFRNSTTGYNGFQIVEKTGSPQNNFTIRAGEAIVAGWRVVLLSDIDYVDQVSFTSLTPPGSGTRVDEIYLEVDEFELGVASDVDIATQTPSGQIETSRRLQQRALVKVSAGALTPTSSATVKRLKLAVLSRTTSTSILSSMIENTAHKADAPLTPIQLDVTAGYDEQTIQDETNLGFRMNRPRTNFVRAEWGDTGNGVGTTNTLTVGTNRVGSYTTNEWAGYTLIDANGNQFEVTANTSNTITVSGTPVTGAFVLGSNASEYLVVLVPVVNTVPQWERSQQKTVSLNGVGGTNSYATQMSVEFNGLPAGVTYNVYVASKGKDNDLVSKFSAASTVETVLGTQLVMSPITAKTVNYGVQVNWASVVGAQMYEVVWNNDNTIADFGNPRHYVEVTANTAVLVKGLAGEIIQVGVRAVDGSGQVSENAQHASARCGGVSLEKNLKYLGPFWFSKGASDNTKALRKILEIPLENGIEIVRLSVYATAWTCGTPCSGGVNDGKIRTYRQGDESSVVNILTNGTGLKDQVAALVIPSASILVVDAWDSYWDTTAPSVFPVIEGYAIIAYVEGEFISQVVAEA